MKASLEWLKKYIDLSDYSVEEVSDMLTTLGLEVEGIEEVESIKGGLNGLVVGKVLSREKHENADKLSVCQVDVGAVDNLQIVCGAPNVAEGQMVCVALVGALLYPSEGDPFKIKKSKIRGVESSGMICAEDEIGLGQSHDGIMVLDNDAVVGTKAADHFGVTSDTVFDIGLTPNRSDATCHIGIAKDLLAYIRTHKDENQSMSVPSTSSFHVDDSQLSVDVEVKTKACPRYTSICISNVEIGESPDWLKKNLEAIGVKSINNIVDITNYILHETGQPLHAFDYDLLENKKIVVDHLPEGTKFKGLDEREFVLSAEDIMICDSENNGLCIGGVFGGYNSGVTNNTKNIFLESAHFEASSIRKTSMRLNLRTDAAKVFEKGSDPNITEYALKRAAIMIAELANGTISSKISDIYPKTIEPKDVQLSYEKVNRILGVKFEEGKINQILNALEMGINNIGNGSLKVAVPTNKSDVTRDVDLIEEILRVYGFNNIPIPSKVVSNLSYSKNPDPVYTRRSLSGFISDIGFNEMMGLSLIDSQLCIDVLGLKSEDLILINNTSNLNLDAMRPDLLLSGLQSVSYNINRQQSDLRLFEYGKTYKKKEDDFVETEKYSLFITGKRTVESWRSETSNADFFDIKKAVEQIFYKSGISGFQVSELDDPRFNYGLKFHRGPQVLACFGEVKSKICKAMGIKIPVYYAEIEFDALLKAIGKTSITVQPIGKFPSIRRDLSIVVDLSVKFSDIQRMALKVDKKILRDISLFDIYVNADKIGDNKKALSVSYIFGDDDKTLNDKQIDKIMSKMIANYTQQLNAVIRQ